LNLVSDQNGLLNFEDQGDDTSRRFSLVRANSQFSSEMFLYIATFDLEFHNMTSTVGISAETKSITHISLVVPVYNQETKISIFLKRLKEALNSTLLNYELIVINDGSSDNTLEILREEEKLDNSIRIISYSQNKGKGYAVKKGIMHALGDIILFIDGDLEVSPVSIQTYIEKVQNHDLVIASKSHPLSKVNAPVSRKFLSRVFNLYVRFMTGVKLKDTQSGLKAGDGDALRRIFTLIHTNRYAFDVELLAIANALKMTVEELPIEITLTHMLGLNDIAKMFIDVIAISYKMRISLWYRKQLRQQEELHKVKSDIVE
jgi:dolichol-phosphate mannosyltransferase